jgi:hypothetical protein
MKNTFKYILAAAALMTGLTTFAQNLPDGVYILDESGVAYRKSATLKPGTTDKYIIDLEAFVTGEVTIKDEAVPADIVLVLDVSGSMDDLMYNETKRWTSSDLNSGTTYYYFYEDYYTEEYCEVRYYNNRFQYYRNYGWHNLSNGTSWSGTLYWGEKKIDALKTAVGSFIETIQENDLYDVKRNEDGEIISKTRRKDADGNDTSLGNQIAIVKFAGDRYTDDSTTWNSNNAPITVSGDGNNHYQDGYYTYNNTEVVKGFTLTATDANVSALKTAVNAFDASGATASDFGMNLAYRLIASLPTSGENDRSKSSKTVVFFTDGSPTYSRGFDPDVATHTISRAYDAKNDYKVNVFTIGVFSNLGSDESRVNNYMNYTSSNYPDAKSMSQPGNPIAEAKRVYYQNASNADLTSIFTMVAQQSGGSGNTDVTAESAVTVDVISSSFSLPEGVEPDDITVKVAPCTGQTTKTAAQVGEGYAGTYLTFGEAKVPTEYGLPPITPEVDPSTNTVSTKGFDFSDNYCAAIDDHGTITGGRGYKQIISFEITVNPDAVGGPNVVTNDDKSGIYLKGKTEPLVTFNRPTVEIPIQIWIKKKGLLGEDSAVFNIQYTNYVEGVDPRTIANDQWKSFDKVMVNSNSPKDKDGLPMEKLVGLNPHFFYRIKEDAWAWSYNYQDNGIQYTFGEDQVNPFIFENLPKETPKEAEATVRNTFNEKTTTKSPETGGE